MITFLSLISQKTSNKLLIQIQPGMARESTAYNPELNLNVDLCLSPGVQT